MKYRPLDPERDWDFFMPSCVIPIDCLPHIRPLTEGSARDLWHSFISRDSVSNYPALLPADAWPVHLLSSSVFREWRNDWNDDASTAFIDWLRGVMSWPKSTPLLFTWSATESVETSWEVFCRCWRNFLFEHEGPILWSLQQPQAARFMPSQLVFVGERPFLERGFNP